MLKSWSNLAVGDRYIYIRYIHTYVQHIHCNYMYICTPIYTHVEYMRFSSNMNNFSPPLELAVSEAQERQDWLERIGLELRRARERCLRDMPWLWERFWPTWGGRKLKWALKRGPKWLFRVYTDEILPNYVGTIINHYSTTIPIKQPVWHV